MTWFLNICLVGFLLTMFWLISRYIKWGRSSLRNALIIMGITGLIAINCVGSIYAWGWLGQVLHLNATFIGFMGLLTLCTIEIMLITYILKDSVLGALIQWIDASLDRIQTWMRGLRACKRPTAS